MTKRILPALIIGLMAFGIAACNGGLADGNIIGVVVYEDSGEAVVNPWLIIGRTYKSPTVPDQQIRGDSEGRFEGTVPGGNYTIQISSSRDGPFYTWPDTITVPEHRTVVVLLKLPEGY